MALFLHCVVIFEGNSIHAIDRNVGNKGNLQATVGGSIDFRYSNLSTAYKPKNHEQKNAGGFAANKTLDLTANGSSDNGFSYGGYIRLSDKIRLDSLNQSYEIFEPDTAYIYLESEKYGQMRLGSAPGASTTTRVGAENIAVATGGIDGDFSHRLDGINAGSGNTGFGAVDYTDHVGYYVDFPGLFFSETIKNQNANKVYYSTPNFYGINLSLSYAPDLDAHGPTQEGEPKFDNGPKSFYVPNSIHEVVEYGANYNGEFYDDYRIKLGITGVTAKSKKQVDIKDKIHASHHGLRSYNIGGLLGYKGFSIAGSYANLGKSLTKKNLPSTIKSDKTSNKLKTNYYTLGAAYNENNIGGVSLTYMNSNTYGNKFSVLSLGGEYVIVPGLTAYAETNLLKYKSHPSLSDQTRKKHNLTVTYIGTCVKILDIPLTDVDDIEKTQLNLATIV